MRMVILFSNNEAHKLREEKIEKGKPGDMHGSKMSTRGI